MAGKKWQKAGKPGSGSQRTDAPRGGKPYRAPGKPRSASGSDNRPVDRADSQTGRRPEARQAKPERSADNATTKPRSEGQQGPDYSARPIVRHEGDLPSQKIPIILESANDPGYELLDSGAGQKLERYGPHRIVRPEAQALWPKRLSEGEWNKADALFTGDTEEDGLGRWAFPGAPLGETWPMQLLDVDFWGRLTSFRHVGVFPEQIAHWQFMVEQIRARRGKVKVLNLFGYTGVASLIAAHAGAEVTHVDASKKAIGWGRENQALAGLEDRPIRWLCDDAMKFLLREERRGNHYDLILTDPPKFGRGPNGEVWHLFDHLPLMLDLCRALMAPKSIGIVLTAYSIRASFFSIHELMRETMRGMGGTVESGELIIRESETAAGEARALSTSLFSRWLCDGK